MIYMYDVTVVPPWSRPYRRSDKKLFHDTVALWKAACPSLKDHQYAWVFDGYKQLYSIKKLSSDDFPEATPLTVWCREEEREVPMVVRDVSRVADIKVTREILEWAASGRSGWVPQDAIQALDVVLKQAVNVDINFENIGRSYFPTKGETLDVGFGKEVWIGTFSSLRPVGWKSAEVLLTLNVDTANKPGTKALHLTKESAAGKGDSYFHELLAGGRKGRSTVNFLNGVTEEQRKTISRDLEGLKVKYEMPCGEGEVRKRQYRVLEMRRKAASLEMISVDSDSVSVAEYFKRQYGVALQFPALPCLWVGSRDRSTYIPAEFCSMTSQPLPRKKKLADDAVAKMIKQTAVKPLERQAKIMEGLKMNNDKYKKDPFAKEFGISVAGEVGIVITSPIDTFLQMTKLTGRILDPPSIEYKLTGKMRNVVTISKTNPGLWRQDKNQYLDGSSVDNWALLDLSRMDDAQHKTVVAGFVSIGKENGITFSSKPHREVASMRDLESAMATIEGTLAKVVAKQQEKGQKLDLVLIVFPFKAGCLYDKIKHLGDMKMNISTQWPTSASRSTPSWAASTTCCPRPAGRSC
jgi:eukaryotic translation initiation factor 2C